MNRDLLDFRLLIMGIDGRFFKAHFRAPVKVNDLRTGWFPTSYGVNRRDVFSPTLFTIYVNDLEIKHANLAVEVADIFLSVLLYADDIVLLAETEDDLQYVKCC